jgi:hypothetical protein
MAWPRSSPGGPGGLHVRLQPRGRRRVTEGRVTLLRLRPRKAPLRRRPRGVRGLTGDGVAEIITEPARGGPHARLQPAGGTDRGDELLLMTGVPRRGHRGAADLTGDGVARSSPGRAERRPQCAPSTWWAAPDRGDEPLPRPGVPRRRQRGGRGLTRWRGRDHHRGRAERRGARARLQPRGRRCDGGGELLCL